MWLAAGCSLFTDLSGLAGDLQPPGAGLEGGADSGRDVVTPEEAAPTRDAGRCDPTKAFGAPAPLAELDLPGENDRAARLTPDELTIYFSSDRSNIRRIYRATRARTDDAFGPPALLDELTTPSVSFTAAAPSADGLELIIEQRAVDAGGGADLHRLTRATMAAPFGNATDIGSVNTAQDETDPHLGAGDLELWFARPAIGGFDIFLASRPALAAPFGPASSLAGVINRPSVSETDPVPSADGTELFFQSDRDGPSRIFVAHRTSPSEPFGAPAHVKELDGTGTNDVPNWLSTDRCVLYMTSTPGSGISDLYVATRPR